MKLKFYLSSFLFIMSGILFVNAQEQKGNSGEEVFSASKKTEKSVDAAASVTVIDSKTIENRPTTNVTQLLDNVVGLTLDRQGANRYNITMRDAASVFNTSTVVLLDHRQISTIGLQVFDAANSSLSGLDLEKIEVVRGGTISSTYGAYTNSGVVHFMTKDPFKYPGTSIEVSSGGLANQESMLGKGNWDIFQASVRHALPMMMELLVIKLMQDIVKMVNMKLMILQHYKLEVNYLIKLLAIMLMRLFISDLLQDLKLQLKLV